MSCWAGIWIQTFSSDVKSHALLSVRLHPCNMGDLVLEGGISGLTVISGGGEVHTCLCGSTGKNLEQWVRITWKQMVAGDMEKLLASVWQSEGVSPPSGGVWWLSPQKAQRLGDVNFWIPFGFDSLRYCHSLGQPWRSLERMTQSHPFWAG